MKKSPVAAITGEYFTRRPIAANFGPKQKMRELKSLALGAWFVTRQTNDVHYLRSLMTLATERF